MALPVSPPTKNASLLPVHKGSTGYPVLAVQSALATAGAALTVDGVFGPKTDQAIRSFQRKANIGIDGSAGPVTQRELTEVVCAQLDKEVKGIPAGLARGMAAGEGGNALYAVNWAVPGGVDCGLWQHRVEGPPYDRDELRTAFLPLAAGKESLRLFVTRVASFRKSAWAKASAERAIRCAVMAHNWPVGAADIARTGKCASPDALCTWLPRENGRSLVHFPDGTLVNTRWEWCQFYAMGGPHGEALITKYVTRWT